MKSSILVLLSLSTITMNVFAMSNPFSGALMVGKSKSDILVSLYGYPAKKVYSNLSVKSVKTKTADGKNATLKSGNDITCLRKDSSDEVNCRILLNTKGDSEKLADFSINDKKLVEGFATGGGLNDYLNITLNSSAANELAKLLKDAKVTSKRTGSLLTTTRSGLSVTCTSSAEVAYSTVCKLSVDANGNVNGNFLK